METEREKRKKLPMANTAYVLQPTQAVSHKSFLSDMLGELKANITGGS
jgi:hypothetical protein